MTRFGGAGFEAAGDPMGGGGALHVLRARAIEGQTVRVTFSAEPKHRSAAALDDATNPANYVFVIMNGTGVVPVCVGVKRTISVFPALGVYHAGEVALDVQVDRPLVNELTYRVTARAILAMSEDPLGFPYAADFIGAVRRTALSPPRRKLGYADFDNSPFSGSYRVDDAGDIAWHTGIASLRKRVYRRLVTPKGSFAFLPGYGVGLSMKKPLGLNLLQALKVDINQQIRQEPEVADVASTLQQNNLGFLILSLQVQTKQGEVVDLEVQADAQGSIVVT